MSPFVWTILAVLTLLLFGAAILDVHHRRIPNRLTGAIAALYPIWVVASPTSEPWLSALGLAAVCFALGAILFAKGLLGGGDVKLISALALFAGPDGLFAFLMITSLSGGGLAVIMIAHERVGPLLAAQLACLGVTSSQIPFMGSLIAPERPSLPYGVAIATGGLAVVFALLTRTGG